jgi:hypothetical protein
MGNVTASHPLLHMATIINNDGTPSRVERTSGDAGWAIAIVVLVAVILVGGYFWMRSHRAAPAAAPSSNGGANINVTLPSAGGSDTGGSGSADGSGSSAQ